MSLGIGIYVKNSKEAVALYCEAFGLKLGYNVLLEDGNFFHSELLKDDVPFLSVAEANDDNFPGGIDISYVNPTELGYTVYTDEEFYRVFNLLSENGTALMEPCSLPWSPLCAVILDNYGARWYISMPQHRPEDDAILF